MQQCETQVDGWKVCDFCGAVQEPLDAFYRVEWPDGHDRLACQKCLREVVPTAYWLHVYKKHNRQLPLD